MALKFKSSDLLQDSRCAQECAFCAVIDAVGSNDPERVSRIDDDVSSALNSIESMAKVMAQSLYQRHLHPDTAFIANDADLAEVANTIADLSAFLRHASVEANNARFALRKRADEQRIGQGVKTSQEG